ncbi:Rv3235 family protein [Psychromicrobium xiongbiense]|uniref:Rv3235 family protein n=1 Tax=Psychromicrobium xiongbiense TaxID=3051184 RepID=UPI0025553953|nr:Rv3235 family protein [Psychromicrobium sp. YIM S02556]
MSAVTAEESSSGPEPRRLRVAGNSAESAREQPQGEVVDLAASEARKVRQFAATVAQAALEVLAGVRPVSQVRPYLDSKPLRNLEIRLNLTQRALRTARPPLADKPHHALKLRSVHYCKLAPGVYELSVVIAERIRHRAVALRVEQRANAWRVMELQII